MGFFPSWPFRKRPCRPLLWLAGLLLVPAALGIVPPAEAGTATPSEVDIAVEDGVLSVHLRNARLEDVLRAIAERTGLRFRLAGDLGSPVTAWFSVPVAEGIRQLAGDNGLIMIYAPSRGQVWQAELTEVRVSGAQDGHVVIIEPAKRTSSLNRVYGGFDRVGRQTKLRALQELYGLGDEATLDDLALILAQEPDQKIRRLAAFGLGISGNTKALTPLGTALGDKDRTVRFQAIHGLSQIGGHESAEALTPLLRDHDPAVRLQTVLALQRIGDAGTARALGEVLAKDKDPRVRRLVVRTLEKLGGDEAWWAIFDATSDPDPKVREAAVKVIGRPR